MEEAQNGLHSDYIIFKDYTKQIEPKLEKACIYTYNNPLLTVCNSCFHS